MPALDRLEHDALADLADVVDAALRGGVHLDDVERGAVRDRDARVADLVRGRASGRWRSSAPWRGCARATSSPSRAGPRTGRPGAPALPRSRCAGSGRRPPGRRPRRSPAAGISGRGRSRRMQSIVRRWRNLPVLPDPLDIPAWRRAPDGARSRTLLRGRVQAGAPDARSSQVAPRHLGEDCLALLPPGPDAVRRLPVRGTWLSTLASSSPSLGRRPLERGFSPAKADCGFREPLAPHLARPGVTRLAQLGLGRLRSRWCENGRGNQTK